MAAIEMVGFSTAECVGRLMNWLYPRAIKVLKEDFATAVAKLGYRTGLYAEREDWLTPSIRIILSVRCLYAKDVLTYSQLSCSVCGTKSLTAG